MMDAIGQLMSAEGTSCSLKDFYSHYSESFDGRGGHINVEN